MACFTTETYQMKREILNFSKKLSSTPDIADQLHEPSKKVNTVERLSKHLLKQPSVSMWYRYLEFVRTLAPSEPVIYIDDSDVTKPDEYHFDDLGIVCDGSESITAKNVYKTGYHVTEACVLAKSNRPVSIFSRIHS